MHKRHPDHWNRKAKAEGYAARSVYKLEEIDRRFRVLPRGSEGRGPGRVVDLGCCPGSWSRFVRERCGRNASLVGVDWQEVENFPGTLLKASVFEVPAGQIRAALGGAADLVLSDMAPFTTGNRLTDHVTQLELAQCALQRARELLRPGGAFVVKVFDGEDAPAFVAEVKRHFSEVKRVKPEATRDISVEFFLVGTGFLPTSRIRDLPEVAPETPTPET